MKKTLLIITLFIGLGTVNAQFNANWEETVTFIQNYSSDLYSYDRASCKSGNNEISIEGKELLVKFKFRDGSGEATSKVDLSKLKNISIKEDFIVLELTGDYKKSSNNTEIHFCDNDIMERMYNAFRHLTYLATTKRK